MRMQWKSDRFSSAFTLLELLVSMAILLVLMVMIFSMLDSTTSIWRKSTSKIQAFQESRVAFDAITRKLSQATLNTYWDYEYDATGNPTKYKRQSELHFISGQVNTLLGTSTNRFTHAVFFQAPIGYVSSTANRPLNKLLNAGGFYLEYGDDSTDRPTFLPASIPLRKRFRMREMWQPSENLTLYSLTSPPPPGSSSYPTGSQTGYEWFRDNWLLPASGNTKSPETMPGRSRVLAENIIALVILPRLPDREDYFGTALAPNYSYSSRQPLPSNPTVYDYQGKDKDGNIVAGVKGYFNSQLPPQVQVTMIALDEASAARLESLENDSSKTLKTILTDSGSTMLFSDASKLAADTALVEQRLIERRLTYRVFNTTVTIQGAKWSNN